MTDFEPYRVDGTQPLVQDFFVPDDSVPPPGVKTVWLDPAGAKTK